MVAEGVEDQATWQALGALGCELAQGYHLAPPMPPDQATVWLRRHLEQRTSASALAGSRSPQQDR
jgi:EAL domain-containing protein (putative c-di-GMP-specific phosphodiesterase class I)